MNMSRIIVSAQVLAPRSCSRYARTTRSFFGAHSLLQAMDWIILHAFKWNGALEFYPNFGFSQVRAGCRGVVLRLRRSDVMVLLQVTTIQDGVISPFDGAIVLRYRTPQAIRWCSACG